MFCFGKSKNCGSKVFERSWFRLKKEPKRHTGQSDLCCRGQCVLCRDRQCILPLLQLLHGGSDLIGLLLQTTDHVVFLLHLVIRRLTNKNYRLLLAVIITVYVSYVRRATGSGCVCLYLHLLVHFYIDGFDFIQLMSQSDQRVLLMTNKHTVM